MIGEPMTEDELLVVLQRQIEQAMGREDGEVSLIRSANLSVFRGDKYGDERTGHSQHVARDVAEVVEWVLADILEVFASNERQVEYRPLNPEDEEQARQESDVANYYLMGSFMTTYTWAKSALIDPAAYTWWGWHRSKSTRTYVLEGVLPPILAGIMSDPNIEILAQESYLVPGVEGLEAFNLQVRETIEKGRPKIQPYPGEQVLISPSLHGVDVDDASFSGVWEFCTLSELREEFADNENALAVINMLTDQETYDRNTLSDERTNRHDYEDEEPQTLEDPPDESMQRYKVYRLSVVVDFDGDGVAERRRIVMTDSFIIENEPDDYQPLVAMVSIPLPHKHLGMSFVEISSDIQRVKTQLIRQLLDNLYTINSRRKYVHERALTDDGGTLRALTNARSELVLFKGDPNSAIVHEQQQSLVQEILPVLTWFDERKKMQTGVAPDLHMDPGMLQRVAAEPMMAQQSAANKRVKMLVRVMAETGFAKGMLKLHYLLRTHQDQELHIKLHNRVWVQTQPSSWQEREDVMVSVGLGFQNTERRLATLMQLLQLQMDKLAPMNLATPGHIFNALTKMSDAMDIGDARQFFADPNSPDWQPPQPPPPDPLMMAQVEHLTAQSQNLAEDNQRKAMEAQAAIERDRMKIQVEMAKIETAHSEAMQKLAIEEMMRSLELSHASQKNLAEVRHTEADTELKLTQADKLEKTPVTPKGTSSD